MDNKPQPIKIKFYKNEKHKKIDKAKLFRAAFKEAVNLIIRDYSDKSYTSVYNTLLNRAKKTLIK